MGSTAISRGGCKIAPRLAVLALAFAGLGSHVPASFAQDTGSQCVPIVDDAARLECFDKAFGAPADDAVSPNGEWKVRTETSRLVDRVDVYLSVQSSDVVPIDYGKPQRGSFEIRCLSNVTTAVFWVGGNYLSEHGIYGQLLYRVDDRASETTRADTTIDSERIGLLSGTTAIPFIRTLFGAERLLVSIRPVNQSDTPVEMEFNITGLEQAAAELRRSCGW